MKTDVVNIEKKRCERAAPAAVLCAMEFSQPDKGDADTLWVEMAEAIKNNPEAREAVQMFAESGGEEDEIMLAAGFGMVAGIMYAGIMYARNDLTDSKERKPVSS